jgi:hypothetical protein
MKPAAFLILVGLFDFLGLVLGYQGVARLRRLHWPPFHTEGLFTSAGAVWPPPDWLILAWDSPWGRAGVWSGLFLFVGAALFLSIGRQRYFTAAALLLAWTAASGVVGFWIWMDAVMNATAI